MSFGSLHLAAANYGTGARCSQQAFLGIARHTWADVLTYLGDYSFAPAAVHLILHGGYVKCLPGRLKRRLMRAEAAECET
ncbi:MAG: hypothetical protein WCI87_08530 [Euryarchaeota archaeon]